MTSTIRGHSHGTTEASDKAKKNYFIHYVECTTQYSVLRIIDIINYIVRYGLLNKDLKDVNPSCHGGKKKKKKRFFIQSPSHPDRLCCSHIFTTE